MPLGRSKEGRGTEMNGTNQLLVCADDVNLVSKNINIIKKNIDPLLDATKKLV
jgi:hypothetical protein